MICQSCRTAGDLRVMANATNDSEVRAGLLTAVRTHHERCPGGTWCDCQHRVNDHANQPANVTTCTPT